MAEQSCWRQSRSASAAGRGLRSALRASRLEAAEGGWGWGWACFAGEQTAVRCTRQNCVPAADTLRPAERLCTGWAGHPGHSRPYSPAVLTEESHRQWVCWTGSPERTVAVVIVVMLFVVVVKRGTGVWCLCWGRAVLQMLEYGGKIEET